MEFLIASRLDGEYLLCADHITLTDCKLYNKCQKTWDVMLSDFKNTFLLLDMIYTNHL